MIKVTIGTRENPVRFNYVNGNCGIGVGLQNIMKTGDGPALGMRASAAEDFSSDDDILW